MSSKQHENRVSHLVDELQHWVWQRAGERFTPSREEFRAFLDEHFSKMGIALADEEMKTESVKVPALLQKKQDDSAAKRMRELAGIPHKRNFT